MSNKVDNGKVGEDVKEQAYRICQEFLGSPWQDITKSKFEISVISGGNSNAVYRCSLSEDVAVEDPKTPSSVLFRIYGCFQEDKNVVVSEAATFMLLAERGLGPKLYGIFPTGRLEEYIPSRNLNSVDFRSMSTAIAREMAKIHALEVPVRKVGDFWHKHMKNGGNSNAVYRCSLSEDVAVEDPKTPSSVLFRIYGCFQEDKNVVVSEAATFMLLAERGLGPKLYGIFPTGRLEEYIPSRNLNSADFRSLSTAIAREMAKIHALEVPVRKVGDFWHKHMKNWLNYVEINKALRPKESFECIDMYKEEIDWLSEEIKKFNSPVVYCHNDLQGGNILLRQNPSSEDAPRIILIDFEYGAYNYRGFDLANQFCEWCFEYETENFPYFTWEFEKFPSVEEQTVFIRAYLNQQVEEGIIERSAIVPEVDKILEEVQFFSLACNIMWSLWSVQMSFKVNEDFALLHMEHTKLRTKAYWQFKEKYLNSRAINGNAESSSRL
ncbi:hypothetical protein JTE90_017760 [Oedothorax gibbosus]|uniref:Choline/ethanolamine kinase n=1 Tax=Oedothorax gibbosus TaxID=931172 RepID=A0AAV6UKD0_9ARAC|nr:hypothetical protein JTE90_017760 [Oedothorax gibbosus]